MGFASSTLRFGESNKFIMDKEDALAFTKASSKAIELAVHKCSNGDNISARGLAALLESLDCSDSCPILD